MEIKLPIVGRGPDGDFLKGSVSFEVRDVRKTSMTSWGNTWGQGRLWEVLLYEGKAWTTRRVRGVSLLADNNYLVRGGFAGVREALSHPLATTRRDLALPSDLASGTTPIKDVGHDHPDLLASATCLAMRERARRLLVCQNTFLQQSTGPMFAFSKSSKWADRHDDIWNLHEKGAPRSNVYSAQEFETFRERAEQVCGRLTYFPPAPYPADFAREFSFDAAAYRIEAIAWAAARWLGARAGAEASRTIVTSMLELRDALVPRAPGEFDFASGSEPWPYEKDAVEFADQTALIAALERLMERADEVQLPAALRDEIAHNLPPAWEAENTPQQDIAALDLNAGRGLRL